MHMHTYEAPSALALVWRPVEFDIDACRSTAAALYLETDPWTAAQQQTLAHRHVALRDAVISFLSVHFGSSAAARQNSPFLTNTTKLTAINQPTKIKHKS